MQDASVEEAKKVMVQTENPFGEDYKNNKPDADVKIAAQGDDVLKSAPLIRKSDKTLQKAITKAIKELKSEGKLKEISSKYFKEDVSQPK